MQTARQGRNESPQEFADRCRSLAQKVMGKSDDPQNQRIHRENAERMLLSSFLSELHGVPGRQIRISNPQDINQAIKIAITLQEAERQERFNESFYARFDKSVRMCSRSPGRSRSENEGQQQPADPRTESCTRTQRFKKSSSAGRSVISRSRNTHRGSVALLRMPRFWAFWKGMSYKT